MSRKEHVDLSPAPASLLESLRDVGYSMETAIADILDNSITAKAKNIDIQFSWNFGTPWIAIVDDGIGMSQSKLIKAMRFGSMSPTEIRARDDLGRFGLGLKTASFSQCRQLTVLTKQGDVTSICQWDLNHVVSSGLWELRVIPFTKIVTCPQLFSLFNAHLSKIESGTIVLWDCLDRIDLVAIKGKAEIHLNSLIDDVRKHLELVFHRFLSPGSSNPGLKQLHIRINGRELDAYDPFSVRTSSELPEEHFTCKNEKVTVQPYLLAHHNKVPRHEYERNSGEGGYLQNQGFYVYRNYRLIIKSTWFRLLPKSELTKLLRVRVDIPNSLDHLWKIDVKKSNAFPPDSIRSDLSRIIGRIEVSGKKVYGQRGRRLSTAAKTPVWTRRASENTVCYEINREHPLVLNLIKDLPQSQRQQLQDLLALFEGQFPVDMFFHDFASAPEQLCCPKFEENDLQRLVDQFITFWGLDNQSSAEQIEELLQVDPFSTNKELTLKMLAQRGIS